MSGRNGRKPKSPAFQWYPPDALGDGEFAEMSFEARGLFITLLSYSWLNGGIPSDPKRITALVRATPAEFRRSWPAVSRCFKPKPDDAERLVNARQERERASQAANRERLQAAAEATNEKLGRGTHTDTPTVSVGDTPSGRTDDAPVPEALSLRPTPVPDSRIPTPDVSPPRAARSVPRKSKPDSPTPGHAEFVEWWTHAFQAQTGAPYAFAHGKDGMHVQRCLKALGFDLDELKRRALILLQCAPEWIAKGGVDLGTLESQLNRLASAGQVDVASGSKQNAVRESRQAEPTSSGLFDHRKKQPRLAQ
jgi:uncharacterized protein YdaU (DUF1376 family)